MSPLPTDRSPFDVLDTPVEHAADHNTIHDFVNDHPTDPAAHSGTTVRIRSRGIVCFTWDDGGDKLYTVLRPLANSLGQHHTFGINSAFLGTANYMTAAQVTQLYADGHEISSHTPGHINLGTANDAVRLVQYAKADLEALTAVGAINTLTYPFGARGATTDQQLYLRYKRLLATSAGAGRGSGGGLPTQAYYYRMDQHAPFVLGRYPWYHNNVGAHAALLNLIRFAAVNPVVVLIYGHNIDDVTVSPTTAEMTEAMTLCSTLGIPCLTISEAFSQLPTLQDPSFEDSTLAFWNYESSGTGSAASVVDTPFTNHVGTRSLKLVATDTASFVYASQGVPVFIGHGQHTLSFRYRVVINSAGSPGSVWRVRWFDMGGLQLTSTQSSALTSTTWALIQTNFTPPVGAVWALVEFLHQNQSGDFYVDHVHFAPTTEGVLG